MKIIHLASEYPPQKVFGLGRFVYGLAREQARCGHKVHVVTNSMGGRRHDVVDRGVHVHRVDFPPPPKPADEGATVTQFNTQLIERVFRDRLCPDADVVNAHDWLTALAGRVVARRLGAAFVVTVHDVVVGKRFGKLDNDAKYVGNIEHWMCREADRLICVSEHTREEIIKAYGAPRHKTFAIHNAVSEDDFPAPEAKLIARFRRALAGENEKIVLYVGRLDREKGVDVLLRAFAKATGRGVAAKLVIAGTGRLEGELRKLGSDLGIGRRVVFAGYAAGGVLGHLYRSAQLLAVPSLYEPFGIVALEGMICGLPVVASGTGGLAEIVRDRETGILVPPGDEGALARALGRVLGDRALASRLGAGGRKRARDEFSWSAVSKRIEEIIVGSDKTPGVVVREPNPAETSTSAPRRDAGRILLIVQTHEPDFPLLDANRAQFASLAEQGHAVAFLCYSGEGRKLTEAWRGIAGVIEVDVPRGHDSLVHKVVAGYRAAVSSPCDWIVKIDSDTLIMGDIPEFLGRYPDADAVGAPSTFAPVLDAIRSAGPPQVPGDCLDRTGGRYVRGFFYCVRRRALEKALPLVEGMAPRMRVEDAVVTASLVTTGARLGFCDFIPSYVSLKEPEIDLRSPVFHVESRDEAERRFFVDRANALFCRARPLGTIRAIPQAARSSVQSLVLSVVIHVRDREPFLLRLLATLRNGWPTDEPCELVIVDYGGTDGLAADLQELDWPELRYIYADAMGQFSSAHARNIAFRASRGRWILGLDCDLLVPGHLVKTVLRCYRKRPDVAVYGPVYKLMPADQDKLEAGEWDPVRDFDRLRERALPHRIDAPSGAILSAPKARIIEVGGYDEDFTGYGFQDIDLVERLRRSGLPQSFPEDIYALHQFHGYPRGYNTPRIESRNRRLFLATRSTIVRNAGRAWGRLPQGELDLPTVGWLVCTSRVRRDIATGGTAEGSGVVVWCEDAVREDVELVSSAAGRPGVPGRRWRWLTSRPVRDQRARRALASLPHGHRCEVHSTAQVTTQFARAGLVVILASSAHADELADSATRMDVRLVVAGEGASADAPSAADTEGLTAFLKAWAAREAASAPRRKHVQGARVSGGPIRKVLVGMDEGIGNMVMLTPMLQALSWVCPGAAIHVIGRRPALSLLDGWDVVSRTIAEDERPDGEYDLLLVTGWRCGLKRRLNGVRFARQPIKAPKLRLDVHETEQHMGLVRELGYRGDTPPPRCAFRQCELPLGLTPRVGLGDTANPLPQWERKRWPHFRELAKRLTGEGCGVFAFGDRTDAHRYESVPWPEGVVSLQGKLGILETAGALRQMDVAVANDSGLAHVAAALGVPTVCIWGPTSIGKNAPRGNAVTNLSLGLDCSPCQMTQRWERCKCWRCMADLKTELVLRRVREFTCASRSARVAGTREGDAAARPPRGSTSVGRRRS